MRNLSERGHDIVFGACVKDLVYVYTCSQQGALMPRSTHTLAQFHASFCAAIPTHWRLGIHTSSVTQPSCCPVLIVQVTITPPYPGDVSVAPQIDDEDFIRVSRSCTALRVKEKNDAFIREVKQERRRQHMSLWSFELIMMLLLGISLPIVYWRKIRIRHL